MQEFIKLFLNYCFVDVLVYCAPGSHFPQQILQQPVIADIHRKTVKLNEHYVTMFKLWCSLDCVSCSVCLLNHPCVVGAAATVSLGTLEDQIVSDQFS